MATLCKVNKPRVNLEAACTIFNTIYSTFPPLITKTLIHEVVASLSPHFITAIQWRNID